MILKIVLILSVLGALVSILLFIKSGWSAELGRMDIAKSNKPMLYVSIACFVIFFLCLPKSRSKSYKNTYHEFRAEISVDEEGKNCTINLYSQKSRPAATVFTEEIVNESREFLKDWPEVETVKFHTKCGEKILKKSEVEYLNQSAKKDQMAEIGYNVGLLGLIQDCTF